MRQAEISFVDEAACARFGLVINCEIEPGRSEVRRRDPGASDPAVPRHVESIESIQVYEVDVFDASFDRCQSILKAADGTLPPALGEVFSRQILARYQEDGRTRDLMDYSILRYCP